MASSHLKVHLRVRPLSAKEGTNPEITNIVRVLQNTVIVDPTHGGERTKHRYMGTKAVLHQPHRFQCENVFNHYATQDDIFDSVVGTVHAAFEGINGAVMAYGATGSGKTHTMLGGDFSAPGVIPRAAQLLFARKAELESIGKDVRMAVSYYEVYNEQVYDLTVKTRQQQALAVRDVGTEAVVTNSGGCEIPLLQHHYPEDFEEFLKVLEHGNMNRIAAATCANEKSSRSHAILCWDIEVRENADAAVGHCARLKFCDLAGSERAAGTSNRGLRLREGANINKSLLALGAVVTALAGNSELKKGEKEKFVPFRGSKLTRLLKDCLGGNCNSTMVVCISPSSKCIEETLNTLHYAVKAQKIQMNIKRNEFSVENDAAAADAMIASLMEEIKNLKDELRQSKAGSSSDSAKNEPYDPKRMMFLRDKCVGFPEDDTQDAEKILRNLNGSPVRNSVNFHTQTSPAMCQFSHSPAAFSAISPAKNCTVKPIRAEILKKFETLRDEKESLMEQLRRVDEKRETEINQQLRDQQRVLLEHELTLHHAANPPIGPPPPFVAYASQHYTNLMEERTRNTIIRQRCVDQIASNDTAISALHKEAMSISGGDPKDHEILQLQFEVFRKRMNGIEAEELAAQYYQRACFEEGKCQEYKTALERCMAVLKKHIDTGAVDYSQAQEALAFCTIPAASTEEMVTVFKSKLSERVGPANGGSGSGGAITLPSVSHRRSVRMDLMLCEPMSVRRGTVSEKANRGLLAKRSELELDRALAGVQHANTFTRSRSFLSKPQSQLPTASSQSSATSTPTSSSSFGTFQDPTGLPQPSKMSQPAANSHRRPMTPCGGSNTPCAMGFGGERIQRSPTATNAMLRMNSSTATPSSGHRMSPTPTPMMRTPTSTSSCSASSNGNVFPQHPGSVMKARVVKPMVGAVVRSQNKENVK